MRRLRTITLLLTGVLAGGIACRSGSPRDVVPPEPDVTVTEPVQVPVKLTARETAPAAGTVDRG